MIKDRKKNRPTKKQNKWNNPFFAIKNARNMCGPNPIQMSEYIKKMRRKHA